MSTENVSTPSKRAHQDEPRFHPPEVDSFVDHFLSTMCETTRRQILELLAQPTKDQPGPPLERRSTEIARALGLSPSTTSEHLKRLSNAGLIIARREGTTIYYRIRNAHLVQAFHDLVDALHTEHTLRKSRSMDKNVS
jgi:DNA-binding transcriptional ArsR family regulator